MFVNSKSNNNSLFYKIFSIKNMLFFKIITNRYLEHVNSPYYNRLGLPPHICNKHFKKKEGKMMGFVTFIVHLCFNSM